MTSRERGRKLGTSQTGQSGQSETAGLVVLADPDGQPAEWLAKHVGKRHPFIGYVTRGEHAADHRLFPERQDHEHESERRM